MSEAARQNLIDQLTSFGVSFSESWSNETLQILLDAEIAKLERIDRENAESLAAAKLLEEFIAVRDNAELLLGKTSDNQDAVRFFIELQAEQQLLIEIETQAAELTRATEQATAEQLLIDQRIAAELAAVEKAAAEKLAIEQLSSQELLSEVDKRIITLEQILERERALLNSAALAGNTSSMTLFGQRIVDTTNALIELQIKQAEEEERQRLLNQVKVEDVITQTVNDNSFNFLDPLGSALFGLTGVFLRLIVPSPLDIAKNARNQVEAVKILLDTKIINGDIEAFNVEKIQKEIAGG